MTPRRVASALTSLLLCVVLAPAGTAPAVAATSRTLTIGSAHTPVVFRDGVGPRHPNDTVQLSGDLTEPGPPGSDADTPVAGAEVQVYRARLVDEDFELVATVLTDEQGTWRFTEPVWGNSYYLATHEEQPEEFVGSDTLSVPAVRDLNPVKDRVDGHLVMRGRVLPGWRHRPVHLQRRACLRCRWVDLRTQRTGDRGGFDFRISRPASHGRVWGYRAWVVGTERWGRSHGDVFVRG